MSINACMAQDIIELNNKKEYTATATVLLEMVLTDTNLSAHAAKALANSLFKSTLSR